jgi:hypothetical protein
VYGSSITDAGLESLARSPHLGELRELSVTARYTDRGVLALADAPVLARVESLYLMGVGTLTSAVEKRLRKRFAVRFLR